MHPKYITLTTDDLLALVSRAYDLGYREGRNQIRKPFTPDMFWSRVEKTDTCWLWTGPAAPHGYGQLRISQKHHLVHRFAYELTHGPIPKGLVVRHKCDVRLCCNPDHLELGTHADNIRDMVSRGRHVSTAKLTAAQVRAVRSRHASGENRRALAAEYGVSSGTISAIVGRRVYRHIA